MQIMGVAGIGYGSQIYFACQSAKVQNTQVENTEKTQVNVIEDAFESAFENLADKKAKTEETTGITRGSVRTDKAEGEKKAPYSYLAQNGIVEYNGTVFVCDYERNRLCLGDVSNSKDCISVPLSQGGCLVVNRDNLEDLANAIEMFSPEDVRRIMCAIAQDNKAQEVQKEIDDVKNSIGESADADASETQSKKELLQTIYDKMDEIYSKLKNGDIEETIQIGGQSFTKEEWEKLLEKFDNIEETIRELMQEEIKKRMEKEQAKAEQTTDMDTETLVAESTKCSYPSENGEQEKTWYITCYTEEGIRCRKCAQGGKSEDLWDINFTDSSQYQKVMDFLAGFDKDANFTFASRKDFWEDFLTGVIEEADFEFPSD